MTPTTSHLVREHLEPPFRLSLPRRLLLQTATTGAASPDPSALALDSDVVLILAALLCALICVVGLALAARCAWLRRAVAAATSAPSAPAPPNKGLKKKAIRALPKLAFSPAHRATLPFSDCPICLADFAEGDEVRVLPRCAHAFHAPCIDTWLASHSSCPSCRQNLAAKTAAAAAAHPEGAVASTAAAGICAVPAVPPPGGAGRCLWCGAVSSAVDADGSEQRAKGREDGHCSQYLP